MPSWSAFPRPSGRQHHTACCFKPSGAAIACPYCDGLLGFDDSGQPQVPRSGWPVFRYGRAELEIKKQADGEPPDVSLEAWALRHRFTQPGSHSPLNSYTYAEQRPPMRLSRDEEVFLRHWMYDEVHYSEGQGPPNDCKFSIEPFRPTWLSSSPPPSRPGRLRRQRASAPRPPSLRSGPGLQVASRVAVGRCSGSPGSR